MIRSLPTFLRHRRELQRFNDLDDELRSIVFYAEDGGSRPHFERMIEHLTGPLGRDICYLTSSDDHPVLQSTNERIHAFSIGEGTLRTKAFMDLRAGVVVMTMPSLEQYWIKRSRAAEVCYVYVFHSIVSSHMVYVQAAFGHYDTMFCVGPHHNAEVRATEAAYGLTEKRLVDVGYGRLDALLEEVETETSDDADDVNSPTRVLIAPSWGPDGLLENHALPLARILLEAGCHVTVRPHPMTVKKSPEIFDRLRTEFGANPLLVLETDMAASDSLRLSHVMISDWSGAALEYAFSRERPVLFVAVPRKVNNPEYEKISCTPLEVSIRTEIGDLVEPDRLDQIPEILHRMRTHPDKYRSAIREARDRYVYNVGGSGRVGAEAVVDLVKQQASR